MSPKKFSPKPTQAKKQQRFQSIEEETAHYDAILLEEVRDQFKFVTEKVGSMEESLRAQMHEDKTELKQDIADTRNALIMRMDHQGKTLRAEMQVDKIELKQEITDTRNALIMRMDHQKAELIQKIDDVKTELSTKIDRINETVIRHDEQLASLTV